MAQDEKATRTGAGYAGLTVTKLQKAISTEEKKSRLLIKMNITMKHTGHMSISRYMVLLMRIISCGESSFKEEKRLRSSRSNKNYCYA